MFNNNLYTLDYYLSPGDIVYGRYEIIDKLGQGGFGITYKAYDRQQPDLIVVLKQIKIVQTEADEKTRDTSYFTKLEREAKALITLKHPAIPQFFNFT